MCCGNGAAAWAQRQPYMESRSLPAPWRFGALRYESDVSIFLELEDATGFTPKIGLNMLGI